MLDQPRLRAQREVLAPALADRMRGTLRDRVEGVWLALADRLASKMPPNWKTPRFPR